MAIIAIGAKAFIPAALVAAVAAYLGLPAIAAAPAIGLIKSVVGVPVGVAAGRLCAAVKACP